MTISGLFVFPCRCVHHIRVCVKDCCLIVCVREEIRSLETGRQAKRSQGKHFAAF